jgi:hypothetical protein
MLVAPGLGACQLPQQLAVGLRPLDFEKHYCSHAAHHHHQGSNDAPSNCPGVWAAATAASSAGGLWRKDIVGDALG